MIKLYNPKNGLHLAILKGIFDAEGIPIFVLNDNLGSIRTGTIIEPFFERTIMVSEEHYEKALTIIQNFTENIERTEQ